MSEDKSFGSFVLICTGLNLLIEGWVHGFLGLINPILLIFLAFMYAAFFFILGTLIRRYRLTANQILLFGFLFGLYQEAFNTGSVFDPSPINLFGINPTMLILANVFWWGILQSVMVVNFVHSKLGEIEPLSQNKRTGGWILSLGFFLFMLFVTIIEENFPPASLEAYSAVIIVLCLGSILLILSIYKNTKSAKEPLPKQKEIDNIPGVRENPFLNKMFKIHLVLSVVMGVIAIFLTEMTLLLFVLWSIVLGISGLVSIQEKSKGKLLAGLFSVGFLVCFVFSTG